MIEVGISLREQGFQEYQQEDISEFLLRITDELERITLEDVAHSQKMKQEVRKQSPIYSLFNLETESFVQCINYPQDQPSSRSQIYTMLQLEVINSSNITNSILQLLMPEKLDGSNQYQSEQHGLQDAWKWLEFKRLPPVLFVTLKRFNFYIGAGEKVNSRFEFGECLDMDQVIRRATEKKVELAGEQFKPINELEGRNKYRLLSIMMHAESEKGSGHYYAYVRPSFSGEEEWLEFNDSVVQPVIKEEAFERAYGGKSHRVHMTNKNIYRKEEGYRKYSAYMLCYLRETDIPGLTQTVTIPEELVQRFEYQNAMTVAVEEKDSSHFNCFPVYLMTRQTLRNWHGYGPLPPSELGIYPLQSESSFPLNQRSILELDSNLRLVDYVPRNVFREGRRAQLFGFENYHHKLAETLNLRADWFRLWLVVCSRNSPRILCVSSLRESDLEGKTEDKLWLKHCEMEDISRDKFKGGLILEMVEEDSFQILKRRSSAAIYQDQELLNYYRNHSEELRHLDVPEVEKYEFSSFEHQPPQPATLDFSQRSYHTADFLKDQPSESEEETESPLSKKREEEKTSSGGEDVLNIARLEGDSLEQIDRVDLAEDQAFQREEREQMEQREGWKNSPKSSERARKKRIAQDHSRFRKLMASSLYHQETSSKLVFIKFFINSQLFVDDVKGLSLPSRSDIHQVTANDVFREYCLRFSRDYREQHMVQPRIAVLKEKRADQIHLHHLVFLDRVDEEQAMWEEELKNGDCFIIADEQDSTDRPHNSISDSLHQYLKRDLLSRVVTLRFKRQEKRWGRSSRKEEQDSSGSDEITLELSLTDSLESVAQQIEERVQSAAASRAIFYKPKTKRSEPDQESVSGLVSHSKALFPKHKQYEIVYRTEDYQVHEVLSHNSVILFSLEE